MASDLIERVARAAYESQPRSKPYDLLPKHSRQRIKIAARAVIAIVVEEAAAYVEGAEGKIPGTNAFAMLVSGNNQPCMSGDARDRLTPQKRRDFDDATHSLATAIRAMKGDAS